MKKNQIKSLIFLFSAFLLIVTDNIIIVNNVFADAVSDAKKQYNDIENQLKQNDNSLQGVEKEINDYNYDIVNLDSKITQYSSKLSEVQSQIDEVNAKLNEQNQTLQESSQKYNSAQDVYATRLRAIYEDGLPSVVDVLLSSKGISDFFSKLNVVSGMLDYDKNLTSNMESQKKYVDYIKKDIETQKVQLDQLKYDASKSKEALDDTVTAKQNEVSKLQNDKSNLEEKKKVLTQQATDAKNKWNAEMAKLTVRTSSAFSGNFTGKFTWPIIGNYKINAAFADIEYSQHSYGPPHTGTDIGASIGTTVCAMADGKVAFTGVNPGGYGNYMILDHGLGDDGYYYYTMYAHLSSWLVSEGANIGRGQKIALSGQTGNVSGPHLHIEIMKGKGNSLWSVDPMDFFKDSGAPFIYLSQNRYIPYPFDNMSKYQSTKILNSYINSGKVK